MTKKIKECSCGSDYRASNGLTSSVQPFLSTTFCATSAQQSSFQQHRQKQGNSLELCISWKIVLSNMRKHHHFTRIYLLLGKSWTNFLRFGISCWCWGDWFVQRVLWWSPCSMSRATMNNQAIVIYWRFGCITLRNRSQQPQLTAAFDNPNNLARKVVSLCCGYWGFFSKPHGYYCHPPNYRFTSSSILFACAISSTSLLCSICQGF